MSERVHPRYDRRRLAALVAGGVSVLLLTGTSSLVLGGVWSPSSSPTGSSDEPGDEPGDGTTDGTASAPPPPEGDTSLGIGTEGLLTYRGDATRTYYGRGPVPEDPEVLWTYPAEDEDPLCGTSTVGDETREWCGTGWTGQPLIFQRDDRTWATFGAYDHNLHFLDVGTGEQTLPPFPTGDLVKGTETVDPDGYPLVYSGSRDDHLRVVAIDRSEPEELWSLAADDVSPTMWNSDWDASPLIVDDHLYVGGENSRFHIVRLNRSYDDDGLVTVDPEIVFDTPGWDDQLLEDLGGSDDPENVSIEGSVAMHDGVAYFANSGGLVQGWDVSGLEDGVEPSRVFRFWTGDDTDATITIDDDGLLYVATEYERGTERADEVGQLMLLDPEREDPLVWSFHDPSAVTPRGFWATPAIHRDLVIIPSHAGVVYGLDRWTGEVRWEVFLGHQTWSSPVVVDDVWIQGSCDETLRAFDVSDTSVQPQQLWSVNLTGCIESTPAVWDGRIVVGTRVGRIYAVGD